MTPSEILAAIVAISEAIKSVNTLLLAQWNSMSPKQQQTEIDRRQELTEPGFRMLKNLNDQWEKMHPGGAVTTPTTRPSSIARMRADIAEQIEELRPKMRRIKKSR